MIDLYIVKWRSYVSRGDLKHVPWLRINEKMVFDHRIYGLSSDQKWAWIFLLTEAARQNDNGSIRIDKTSLSALARVPESCLDSLLQHLEKHELIEIGARPKKLSDDSHTDIEDPKIQPEHTLHNLTLPDTTSRTPKRGRRKRPATPKHEIYDLSDAELDLGRKWLDMALSEMPHKQNDPRWHPSRFAADLTLVKKALSYTDEQMAALYNWVSSDEFWRPNCCSPQSLLRKKDNGLRKIDTIVTQMKSPGQRKREIAQEIRNDPDRPINPGGTLTYSRLLELTKGE